MDNTELVRTVKDMLVGLDVGSAVEQYAAKGFWGTRWRLGETEKRRAFLGMAHKMSQFLDKAPLETNASTIGAVIGGIFGSVRTNEPPVLKEARKIALAGNVAPYGFLLLTAICASLDTELRVSDVASILSQTMDQTGPAMDHILTLAAEDLISWSKEINQTIGESEVMQWGQEQVDFNRALPISYTDIPLLAYRPCLHTFVPANEETAKALVWLYKNQLLPQRASRIDEKGFYIPQSLIAPESVIEVFGVKVPRIWSSTVPKELLKTMELLTSFTVPYIEDKPIAQLTKNKAEYVIAQQALEEKCDCGMCEMAMISIVLLSHRDSASNEDILICNQARSYYVTYRQFLKWWLPANTIWLGVRHSSITVATESISLLSHIANIMIPLKDEDNCHTGLVADGLTFIMDKRIGLALCGEPKPTVFTSLQGYTKSRSNRDVEFMIHAGTYAELNGYEVVDGPIISPTLLNLNIGITAELVTKMPEYTGMPDYWSQKTNVEMTVRLDCRNTANDVIVGPTNVTGAEAQCPTISCSTATGAIGCAADSIGTALDAIKPDEVAVVLSHNSSKERLLAVMSWNPDELYVQGNECLGCAITKCKQLGRRVVIDGCESVEPKKTTMHNCH
ncbi:unnamed protein product [Umbelopsis vinacea]